jgi:hypothetical protein
MSNQNTMALVRIKLTNFRLCSLFQLASESYMPTKGILFPNGFVELANLRTHTPNRWFVRYARRGNRNLSQAHQSCTHNIPSRHPSIRRTPNCLNRLPYPTNSKRNRKTGQLGTNLITNTKIGIRDMASERSVDPRTKRTGNQSDSTFDWEILHYLICSITLFSQETEWWYWWFTGWLALTKPVK